jgi:hypothetical protein
MENIELLEKLAALEHMQWSCWAKSRLEKVTTQSAEETEKDMLRWKRQIDTPYEQLSEKEKESDREWARKVLELIKPEVDTPWDNLGIGEI